MPNIDTAELWEHALAEWLAVNPKTYLPRPASTRTAYTNAMVDLRKFVDKPLWEVTTLDVKRWIADLRQRHIPGNIERGLIANGRRKAGQLGLSPATINQYIAAVSTFYTYCEAYPVLGEDGSETTLFTGRNTACNRLLHRPKTPKKDVQYLTSDELRRLLDAVQAFGTRNRAKSLRDYALMLCYMTTGGRNSEVRKWRWVDLERRGTAVFYRWANKGKSGSDELPHEAWLAVEAYLRDTGRLAGMKADDYVFTPLCDNATRFKRADGSPIVDAETWSRNHPLSAQEVNRCLRQYADLAGISSARLHVHCLRHSAYMLYMEAGVSLEKRSEMLHHSNFMVTWVYHHRIASQKNEGWAQAAPLLGFRQQET